VLSTSKADYNEGMTVFDVLFLCLTILLFILLIYFIILPPLLQSLLLLYLVKQFVVKSAVLVIILLEFKFAICHQSNNYLGISMAPIFELL